MLSVRGRIFVLLIVGLATPTQHLFAESTEWKQNLNILPPYCKDRAQGGSAGQNVPAKYAVLKGVWIHLHHYCAGIYAEHEAKSALDKHGKELLLRAVVGQMAYVGNHCDSRCVLYPELHTRWGWALAETGQAGEAIMQYQLVINSKPAYSPVYGRLSDLYLSLGKPGEARKVLEQGMKANPKSKMLKRKLAELGS